MEKKPEKESNLYEFDSNATYKETVFSDKWKRYRSEEYFKYRDAWDRIPREKIATDFPMHLDIETTNMCNLRCPMCPRTIMVAKNEFSQLGMISREDYMNIIDEASAHGVKSIKLNYLGEPLMHPDVVWQVDYAKKNGILDIMMNTNGSLLTKKMGDDLLKAGLDNLYVSFDSIKPDVYSVQRKGVTIGHVIDNLYKFSQLRNEIRPSCQIRLSMVMYKGDKWQKEFEALKVMWEGIVDAVGYGWYVDHESTKHMDYDKQMGYYCAQLFQRTFLKYNGDVTICCVDDKDEMVMGNWRENSLKSIWNGDNYRKVRELHSSDKYYDISMCRRCYLPVSE